MTSDEHDDAEEAPIVKLGENKYSVNADISIEDLFEFLEIENLPETRYPSVAGMIYELAETLPKRGTVVKIIAVDEILNEKNDYVSLVAHLTFRVETVEEDRIKKVILTVSREETPGEKF